MIRDMKVQKKCVQVTGVVRFPVRIGEEACYVRGNQVWWTDKVKKILEITADYIRIGTTSYIYTIMWDNREYGQLRAVA